MASLKDRVAIITGASRGIGRALALGLAKHGCHIVVAAKSTASTEQLPGSIYTVAKEVEALGAKALPYQIDVRDADQIEAMAAQTVKQFGRIDILINNVGGSAPGTAVTMCEEVWDAQLDHNLKTAFLACKFVLPIMEAQGFGAIVNLASVAALRMTENRAHVAYSTSKLGMLAFSKSTAIAYAKKGIRCNAVIPGLMHTALVEHRLAKTIAANDVQGLIDRRNAQCPTGKMGDAMDIAHAVLFLASDEARYITAAEILVDGGLSAASGLG